MNCPEVEEREIIERYLASKLSDQELEAFEEHYLACQRCFDELQLRHSVAIELGRQAAVPSVVAPVRWSFGWGWGLAAAAVLLVGFVSIMFLRQPPIPSVSQKASSPVDAREETIARLAAADTVPAYLPWTIRGGKTGLALEKFQRGMQLYTKQDYAGAVVLLRQATRLDPTHEPTLFYLGISCLMTNQLDEANAELSKLTSLEATPYKEESHWYLAKVYFRKKDAVNGQKELEVVVKLKGQHLPEAKQALELVGNLAKESQKGGSAQ